MYGAKPHPPGKEFPPPWWELEKCDPDDGSFFAPRVRNDAQEAFDKFNSDFAKAWRKSFSNWENYGELTKNVALYYSNDRVSEIIYNSMMDSAESILTGMINTLLDAGAMAGAIAGASQVFGYWMTRYSADAESFLQNFKPFNLPGELS
jgi:hypothetical protein